MPLPVHQKGQKGSRAFPTSLGRSATRSISQPSTWNSLGESSGRTGSHDQRIHSTRAPRQIRPRLQIREPTAVTVEPSSLDFPQVQSSRFSTLGAAGGRAVACFISRRAGKSPPTTQAPLSPEATEGTSITAFSSDAHYPELVPSTAAGSCITVPNEWLEICCRCTLCNCCSFLVLPSAAPRFAAFGGQGDSASGSRKGDSSHYAVRYSRDTPHRAVAVHMHRQLNDNPALPRGLPALFYPFCQLRFVSAVGAFFNK